MTKVLFLLDIALKDPKRGTPLHIYTMLREMRRDLAVIACVKNVPDDLADIFIPYPSARGLQKLLVLGRLVREQSITHVFTASQTGLLAPVLLKYLCGTKIVVELHAMDHEEYYADGSVSWFRYQVIKWRTWVLLHFYDTVITMVKSQRDYYLPMSKHWVIAHVAVVPEDLPPQGESFDDPGFTVGYMGNTRAYQGLEYLWAAVALAQKKGLPMHLNLVVSGDVAPITEILKERGLLDITTLHNNVPHTDAYRLISRSSVLAIPRPSTPVTEYAFPSKLPESLATGVPVVLTAVGAVRELRNELKQFAVIIPTEDISVRLAEAFEALYKEGASVRKQRGIHGRAYALAHFNWEDRAKLINSQFV